MSYKAIGAHVFHEDFFMLKRICDFCGEPAIDRFGSHFNVNGQQYRVAILKVLIKNGVRWAEADVCHQCLKTYIIMQEGIKKEKKT